MLTQSAEEVQAAKERLLGSDLDWQSWLAEKAPAAVVYPFEDFHLRAWDWIEALIPGIAPDPLVECWGRGLGKSTTIELGSCRVAIKKARRFKLYVSATQEAANHHVSAIGFTMERVGIERAVNKYGLARGWSATMLRTAGGFTVMAFGLDSIKRGLKQDYDRPDAIDLDDIDELDDSAEETRRKEDVIGSTILMSGSVDCAVAFFQNMVKAGGVMHRIQAGQSPLLRRAVIHDPVPSVVGFECEEREDPQRPGRLIYHITGGTATWAGKDLAACEKALNDSGLESFQREDLHQVRAGTAFFDQFEEPRHVVIPPFTYERKPPAWWYYFGGMDWGYRAPFAFTLCALDEQSCLHGIESFQAVRLTSEQQADRILALLEQWGINPTNFPIGFDESMKYTETPGGLTGETVIEAFYRKGLRCVAIGNSSAEQRAGFQVIRDRMRIPGEPSPRFNVWRGFNNELVHALTAATYDRLDEEKIRHDECSHLSHALRYGVMLRPMAARDPNALPSTKIDTRPLWMQRRDKAKKNKLLL